MPWDEIQKADYNHWKYSLDLGPIKNASSDRMKSSNAFSVIQKNAQWVAEQNDKVVTLSLKKYLEEQRQIKASVKQIETSAKLATELDVTAMGDDLKKFEYDNGKLERFKDWIKRLRTDIYLDEAVNVVNDMVIQKNIVYNTKKQ